MAARRPIFYFQGTCRELSADDGIAGAVLPNIGAQNVTSTQPGEIAVDDTTNPVSLVIRIGDLIWRFPASSITSYAGKLDFSQARNSHWIGVML